MVCTLPGDRLCENLNKIKENVSSTLPGYPLCKISIKRFSSGLQYILLNRSEGIPHRKLFSLLLWYSKEISSVFNLHSHTLLLAEGLKLKEIHIIFIQEFFLSYLSLFGYFLKV